MKTMYPAFIIVMILASFSTTITPVFAHGVHSGIGGYPVGACGINDWHYLQFMKDITFQSTLVIYGLIFGIILISTSGIFKTKIRKNL